MEHCYVLNEHTDYRLAWTVRGRAVDIHVSANAFVADSSSADSSAATANQTWVGIGFGRRARQQRRHRVAAADDGHAEQVRNAGRGHRGGVRQGG